MIRLLGVLLHPWPQLRQIDYTPRRREDVKSYRHLALTPSTRKHITFGNSSTSGVSERNGGNPMHRLLQP